jgi:hypothetical protein
MIEKDILTLCLEAIDKSQQRCRTSFFSATIAAVVVFIVFFNITFSQSSGKPIMPDDPPKDLVFEELKKEQVKHFFDRFFYSLPIVGVQVSTDDLALFAPLALLIFSLYFVSCLRSTSEQLEELYQSLKNITSQDDHAKLGVILKSEIVLNAPSSELPFNLPSFKWLPSNRLLRTMNLYQFLIYLPVLASAAAMYADIYGTYLTGGALDLPGAIYFSGLSGMDKLKVVMFEIVGFALTGLVGIYCLAASRYAKRIREMITGMTMEPNPARIPADDSGNTILPA